MAKEVIGIENNKEAIKSAKENAEANKIKNAHSNYTFIPASSARKSLENLYNLFLENDKTSIGGKLPEPAERFLNMAFSLKKNRK